MNGTPRLPAATDLTLEDRVRLLSGGSVWRTQELDGVPAVTMTCLLYTSDAADE